MQEALRNLNPLCNKVPTKVLSPVNKVIYEKKSVVNDYNTLAYRKGNNKNNNKSIQTPIESSLNLFLAKKYGNEIPKATKPKNSSSC